MRILTILILKYEKYQLFQDTLREKKNKIKYFLSVKHTHSIFLLYGSGAVVVKVRSWKYYLTK